MAPGADSLKEDAGENRDMERLACAQMEANRAKRGVENRFGGLMTGCVI